MRTIFILMLLGLLSGPAAQGRDSSIQYTTDHFRLVISESGEAVSFVDLRTGKDYADDADAAFCLLRLTKEDKGIAPDRVRKKGKRLVFSFPGTPVTATLRAEQHGEYLIFDLEKIRGGEFYSLKFARVPLDIDYAESDFAACSMSRRLNTLTLDFPGRSHMLGGECFSRIGYGNAGVYILGMPEIMLRDAIKSVADSYKPGQMPVNRAGGPYAMDNPQNRGSYIINSEPITAEQVPQWAERLTSLGIDQIDFHQGYPFRQGDFVFNKEAYPGGISDFRRMTDELKKHGIIAGLHTYSELLSPRSKYITPVPHEDLDVIASFTLSEDLDETSQTVRVEEPTADVAAVTGWLIFRSSQIIRIDDELIVFDKPMHEAPWGFSSCKRGAYGTKVSSHSKGAEVEQLNQVYGLFVPKAGSDLFFEIARETARTYNEGGFSMIYLDALDGISGIVEDQETRWYYEALFVNEMLKYVENPPLLEYSAFSPALWYGRSRMGALDAPKRSYDRFFDRHVQYNRHLADRIYLPAQIGWLLLNPSSGDDNFQFDIFFRENVEHLGAQALAYDYGFSYLDVLNPNAHRSGDILKTYDSLRRVRYFSDSTVRRLQDRTSRFLLGKDSTGWFLNEAAYGYAVLHPGRNSVSYMNPYSSQSPMIRIENRHVPAGYDSQDAVDLLPIGETDVIADGQLVCEFNPLVDLSGHRGLGLWIYGDGGGQTVSVRVESPKYLVSGFADHIVKVDFVGWKYFALAEADNGTLENWPEDRESRLLEEFRETVHYGSISKVSLLIDGDPANLRFRTVKALPLVETPLVDPELKTRSGEKIVFHGNIDNGCYMEYEPGGKAVVYDGDGDIVGEMIPEGSIKLPEGRSDLEFSHSGPDSARVRVTLRTNGDERLR